MRRTVHLPEELLKRARRKAAAEGRTLAALIAEGLQIVVADGPAQEKREHIPLRTSQATGGLQPGVDLTKFSDYQEAEDLEYIERMKTFK